VRSPVAVENAVVNAGGIIAGLVTVLVAVPGTV
jgi:hypothetical protein